MLRAPGCCKESLLFPALRNLNAVYFLTAHRQISFPPSEFHTNPLSYDSNLKNLKNRILDRYLHCPAHLTVVTTGNRQCFLWSPTKTAVLKQCFSCRKVTRITTPYPKHQQPHSNSELLMFISTLLLIIFIYLLWDVFQHII